MGDYREENQTADRNSDKIIMFDALFTTNHIQMMKILLPALDPALQRRLAVCIKLSELQYTLRFFQSNPRARLFGRWRDGENDPSGSAVDICSELLPFCSPAEKEKVQNIIKTCRDLENMQEMMQIVEMMQELSPELSPEANGLDIEQTMEMLRGMFA